MAVFDVAEVPSLFDRFSCEAHNVIPSPRPGIPRLSKARDHSSHADKGGTMSEQNKALVRRIIEEIVNRGNFDLVNQLISPEYAYFEPTIGPMRGREGYIALLTAYRNAFPDMKLTIDEQIAEADTVVTRWRADGTHRGELMGINPTGKRVSVQGVVISRITNGQLADDFESYDVHGMLRQLGVAPPLAKAAAA